MNLRQARSCYDTPVLFRGQSYLVKTARIDGDRTTVDDLLFKRSFIFRYDVPLPEDIEVYRVEGDGLQMFVCWLDHAPAEFRIAYARRFLATHAGQHLMTADHVNAAVLHVYATAA